MKKTLLLTALLGLFAMTACNKENEPTNNPTNPDRTQYLEYGFITGDTILHYYNITAYYRDNNSQTVAEPVTTKEWSKRLQGWGDSLSLHLVFTLRDDADTSYSSEWLYDRNGAARIDGTFKLHASAYESDRNVNTYTAMGDPYNQYMDASFKGFHLGEKYWAGLTEMLNRKGDYLHNAIK